MGEMTIKVDDTTLLALKERAEMLGTNVERVASDLLKDQLNPPRADRASVARAILARSIPSPISSVTLLDQIRDEER